MVKFIAAVGFAGLVSGAAVRATRDYDLAHGGLASTRDETCVDPPVNPRGARCPGRDSGRIILCPVRAIPDKAFFGCSGLTQVSFPRTIKIVGSQAFQSTGLSGDVYLPVTRRSVEIAGDAFPRNVTVKFLEDSIPPPTHAPRPDLDADASAVGDPHISNLAGEGFDVNRPGEYVLLRVPLDPAQPAQLEFLGQISAGELENVCEMYIMKMILRGEWLGNTTVQIRPLRRNEPGSNSAGNGTIWPFSLRQTTPGVTGDWRSAADFQSGSGAVERLSQLVVVAPLAMTEDLGSGPEAQAFEFSLGEGLEARIVVSQGQHQALNVQMRNLKALGKARIGGLLGTEEHRRGVEELTMECKASKSASVGDDERTPAIMSIGTSASRLSASW